MIAGAARLDEVNTATEIVSKDLRPSGELVEPRRRGCGLASTSSARGCRAGSAKTVSPGVPVDTGSTASEQLGTEIPRRVHVGGEATERRCGDAARAWQPNA